MSAEFDARMKDVCLLSLQREYEKALNEDLTNIEVLSLNEDQIPSLVQKINALPVDYKNILFSHYCFAFTPRDTEELLETDHAEGKLRYIRKMLSSFMGLGGALIDEKSMKTACECALTDYVATNSIDGLPKPDYSNKFRKKLKQIKSAQKPSNIIFLMLKRVAIFILVCGISFSTLLVVNAEAREQFFNWVVKTFPKFSRFSSQGQETQQLDLESFEIGYIPDGFTLSETVRGKPAIIRTYRNAQSQSFTLTLAINAAFNLNTEDCLVNKLDFKDNVAFCWTKDNITFFVWGQDGIDCNIVGECTPEEAQKMASDVAKK